MNNLKLEHYAEPIWSKYPLTWKTWSIPLIIFLLTQLFAILEDYLSLKYIEMGLSLNEFLSLSFRFLMLNLIFIFIISYIFKSVTYELKNYLERNKKKFIGRIRKFCRNHSSIEVIIVLAYGGVLFIAFVGSIFDSINIYYAPIVAKYSLIYFSISLFILFLKIILFPSYELVIDFIKKEKELEDNIREYLTEEKLSKEDKEDILMEEITEIREFFEKLNVFFGSRTGIPLGNIEEITSHLVLSLIENKNDSNLDILDYLIDINQAVKDNSVADIIRVLDDIANNMSDRSKEHGIVFGLSQEKEEKKRNKRFISIIVTIIIGLLIVFLTPLLEHLGKFLIDFFGV